MEKRFQPIEEGEMVISLPKQMMKLRELREYIHSSLLSEGLQAIENLFYRESRGKFPVSGEDFNRESWFCEGIPCEILELSAQSWRNGRIRINVSIEFQPELSESEDFKSQEASSLDSLRSHEIESEAPN